MYIKVRVSTGMKRESLERHSESSFSVSVREPAKQNLANGKVRELIAEHFHVPIGRVRILTGHHSPSKLLSVHVG